jgi:hypothetical protein
MQVLTGAKVSSEAKMGKSQLPAPPVVGKIHLPPTEEFMTADLSKEREREKNKESNRVSNLSISETESSMM